MVIRARPERCARITARVPRRLFINDVSDTGSGVVRWAICEHNLAIAAVRVIACVFKWRAQTRQRDRRRVAPSGRQQCAPYLHTLAPAGEPTSANGPAAK